MPGAIWILDQAQWTELMGKFDALTAAISGLSLSVPPANLTPIVERLDTLNEHVRDLSYIDVVIDHGYRRDCILGRTQEDV